MQTYASRIILLTLVLLFQIGKTNADGGYTITVFAEFTLKDGRNFKAFFDTHSDFLHQTTQTSDLKKMRLGNDDCMKAFRQSYFGSRGYLSETLVQEDENLKTVYMSLEERTLKPIRHSDYDYYDFWTGIALVFPEDILPLHCDKVRKVTWINCKKSSHSGGIYPTTIGMLDSITNMHYWNYAAYNFEYGYVQEPGSTELGTFHNFFNFNEKYNEAELKRLIHLKYDPNNNPKIREIKNKYLTKGISTLPYEEEEKISKLYRKQISQANAWMWAHGVLVTVHTIGC